MAFTEPLVEQLQCQWWKKDKATAIGGIQGLPLYSVLLAQKLRRLERTWGKTYFVRQEEGVDAGNQLGCVFCIRLATDNDLLREKRSGWGLEKGERKSEREREGQWRGSRLPVFCANEVSRCALEASGLRLDLQLVIPSSHTCATSAGEHWCVMTGFLLLLFPVINFTLGLGWKGK